MSHHRDNNKVRSVEAELLDDLDNPNANTPSPTALAMGLATEGRFPDLRLKFRKRLEALHARYETVLEEYAQVVTQEVVFMEQLTEEAKSRYIETTKWARKNGS